MIKEEKAEKAEKETQRTVINKVLKDTYRLLAITLAFSAITASISVMIGIGNVTSLVLMLVAFGLLCVVSKKAETKEGLFWIFMFTGVMGASLGSIISHYLSITNGPIMIMQSLFMTAAVFFGLSTYVLKTKKDFSFMGGFLMAGLIVAIIAMIANLFLQIPLMSLITSAIVVMIMSGFILYDTSNIINGGEKNYIRATISLYLNILNIFVHLLNILGILDD